MNFQKNHTQKKILSPVKHDQHPETHSLDPWLLYKNKNFFRKKIFAVSFSSKLGYKLSNQIKLVIPLVPCGDERQRITFLFYWNIHFYILNTKFLHYPKSFFKNTIK